MTDQQAIIFFLSFFSLLNSSCGANFTSIGTGKRIKDVVIESKEKKKIALEGTHTELNFFYEIPRTTLGLGGYISKSYLRNKFKPYQDEAEIMDTTTLGIRGYRRIAVPFLVDLGMGAHQSTLKTDPSSSLDHIYRGGLELSAGFSYVTCLYSVCFFARLGLNRGFYSYGEDRSDSTATLRELQSSGASYTIGIANWFSK